MSSARWMACCNGSPRRSANEFNHRGHGAHRGASFFLHPSYFLPMTLGRTSSGAVKIKTDGDAGLRAVNCACCGGSDCIKPTPELKQILETWTSLQVSFTWPAFQPAGIPSRSGSFNIPNVPGCDPDQGPCPPVVEYPHVATNGIETTFFGEVSVTPEGFIFFHLYDTYIGGRVDLLCGRNIPEAQEVAVLVNGRIYPASWVSFEEDYATVSLTFS